jgi:hypothetical protein
MNQYRSLITKPLNEIKHKLKWTQFFLGIDCIKLTWLKKTTDSFSKAILARNFFIFKHELEKSCCPE